MPILHIEVVGKARDYPKDLAQRVADAAGSVLESRPRGTWVKLQFLDAAEYAENGGAGGRPMIVSLIAAQPPSGDVLKHQVLQLTRAIAGASGHPVDNVHVVVEPPARGRIAFGGLLAE